MMKVLIVFGISVLLFFGVAGLAQSTLHYGVAAVAPGWDFSDSASVDLYMGDISIVYVVDPPIGYLLGAWNGAGALISDISFEELTIAPWDTTQYVQDLPALLGQTYVVRTAEHHYAKFRILYLMPVPFIEYVYQSDGSRILDSNPTGIPDPQRTWGQIKAIYGE